MAGFVETLVASKVHPLANKEEDKEEEIINKHLEEGGATKWPRRQQDHNVESNHIGSPKGQPHKDNKTGKITPKRKRRGLAILNTNDLEGRREANVEIEKLSIVCPGRPEIALSHPFISSPRACLFTLKEGTQYKLIFTFVVSNNVVSGLRYEHTLWKAGIRVDRATVMLGTFSPQKTPHCIELEEATLPSGFLFRGLFYARAKVIDDDGRCYMDIRYHFDIQKNWPSIS